QCWRGRDVVSGWLDGRASGWFRAPFIERLRTRLHYCLHCLSVMGPSIRCLKGWEKPFKTTQTKHRFTMKHRSRTRKKFRYYLLKAMVYYLKVRKKNALSCIVYRSMKGSS